jgi:hypothetical protein
MKRDILIKLLDSRDLFDLGFDAIDERCDKILEYINQLESDKIEAYRVIVDNSMYIYWCPEYKDSVELCKFCEEEEHDKDCIVNKAVKYIEEHK